MAVGNLPGLRNEDGTLVRGTGSGTRNATLTTKNKSALYERLKSQFYSDMNDALSNYYKDVAKKQQQYEESELNFAQKTLGLLSIAGKILTEGPATLTFDLLSGLLGGAGDAVAGTLEIALKYAQDVHSIFDDTDGTGWREDLNYTIASIPADIIKGIGTAGIGLVAGAKTMFGDKDAFEEASVTSKKLEDYVNVNIIGSAVEQGRAVDEGRGSYRDIYTDGTQQQVQSTSPRAGFETKQVATGTQNADYIKDYINSRYNEDDFSTKAIAKIIETNSWYQNNIVKPIGEQGAFESDPLYKQYVEPAAQSIGRLIPAVALSFISPKAGTEAGAKALGAFAKGYFVTNVYGRAYQEAIEGGATANDAHIYAVGNAGLELGTEMIGGFVPGQFSPKSFASVLKNIGTETIEELIAEVAGPGLEFWLSPDRDASTVTPQELRERALYSALVGGISGGVFGGIGKLQAGKMVETDLNTIQTELEKQSSRGQKIDKAKLKEGLESLEQKLNDPKLPQWRKDQILNNPIYKQLVSQQDVEVTPAVIAEDGTVTTPAVTEKQYKLTEQGQRLAEGKILATQNDIEINKENYAVGAQEFGQEYKTEVEISPQVKDAQGKVVKRGRKVKVEIATNEDVAQLSQDQQAQVQWAKDNNLRVVFVKTNTRDKNSFAAFTDVNSGIIYINLNSTRNQKQNGFKNAFAHEMHDKMNIMVRSGLVSEKQFEAYKSFVKAIDDGEFDAILRQIDYTDETYVMQMLTPEQKQQIAQGKKWNELTLTAEQQKILNRERISAVIEQVFDNETILRRAYGQQPGLFKRIASIFSKTDKFKTQFKIDSENKVLVDMLQNMQKNFQTLLKEGSEFAYGFSSVTEYLQQKVTFNPNVLFSYEVKKYGANTFAIKGDSYSDLINALKDENSVMAIIGLNEDNIMDRVLINTAKENVETGRKINPASIREIKLTNLLHNGVTFLDNNQSMKQQYDRMNGGDYFLKIGDKLYDRNKFILPPDAQLTNTTIEIRFLDNNVFEVEYVKKGNAMNDQSYEEAESYGGFNSVKVLPDVVMPDGSIKENPTNIIFSLNPGLVNDMIKNNGVITNQSFALTSATKNRLETQQFERLFQDKSHTFTISSVLKPEILSKPGTFVLDTDSFTPIRVFYDNKFTDITGKVISGKEIFDNLNANPEEDIVLKRDDAPFLLELQERPIEYRVIKKDDPVSIMKNSLELIVEYVMSELVRNDAIMDADTESGKKLYVRKTTFDEQITYNALMIGKLAQNIYANTREDAIITPQTYKNKTARIAPTYREVVALAEMASDSFKNILELSIETVNGEDNIDLYKVGQALSLAMYPQVVAINQEKAPDVYQFYMDNQEDFDNLATYLNIFDYKTESTTVEGKASIVDVATDIGVVNINHIGGNANSEYYQQIKNFFESNGVVVTETFNDYSIKESFENASGESYNRISTNVEGDYRYYNTNHKWFQSHFPKSASQNGTQSVSENLGKASVQNNLVFSVETKTKPAAKKGKKKVLLSAQQLNAKERIEVEATKTEKTEEKFNQKEVRRPIPVSQETIGNEEIKRFRLQKIEDLKERLKTAIKNRKNALEDGNAKDVIKFANQVKKLQLEIEQIQNLINPPKQEEVPQVEQPAEPTPVIEQAPVEAAPVEVNEEQAPVETTVEVEQEVEPISPVAIAEVVVTEEVNTAAVEAETVLERASQTAKQQKKSIYKAINKAFKNFIENFLSDIERKRGRQFKNIVALYKQQESIIRKDVRGRLYVNHLSSAMLKNLVMELSRIQLAISRAEGRTDSGFTNPEIETLVQVVNEAIFGTIMYMDDITSSRYISENNPTGMLYARFSHWYLRELLQADFTDPAVVERFNNDNNGAFYRRLINAIYNINEENGFQELQGAIAEFIISTEVDKVNDLSLLPDDTQRTIPVVKAQWVRNAEQIKDISNRINYSTNLPKLMINGKNWGSYSSLIDPYTFLDIQSLFNEFGWGNVLMRKIEEGVKRQIDVDRIFEEIIQSQKFLKENARELNQLSNYKKAIAIANLGAAKLTMGHIIFLRDMIAREILRNRAIDAGIIEGEKSTHFENGNTISILKITDDNETKFDGRTDAKITNANDLLIELDMLIENNPTAKAFNERVLQFFSRLYPLINERYTEINGQPLQSEGIEIAQALEENPALADTMFQGLPQTINADNVDKIYVPIYVSQAGYFKEKSVDLKNILDLGVFDGMTQAIGDSDGIVKVDSIINVLYKYKKEARNYWGLHRVMQDWNDITNEVFEKTPRQEAQGETQQRNIKSFISQQAIFYVEDYLKDLAGYKRGFTLPFFSWARRNFIRAALGANIKSIMSQLTTIYNLSVLYGDGPSFFVNMYKNMYMQMSQKNRQIIEELKNKDNIYYDRTYAPTFDIGEATQGGIESGAIGFNRIMNLLMSGMVITDTMVNNAFYLTLLETINPDTNLPYTPQQAQEVLNKGILRSQSSALDLSKAPILRTNNDVLKMLLKFMGEPLKLQTQLYSSKKQIELIKKLRKNEPKIKEELLEEEAGVLAELQEEERKLADLQAKENTPEFATMELREQRKIRKEISQQKDLVREVEELYNDTRDYVRTTISQMEKTIGQESKAREMLKRRVAAVMGTMLYMAMLNTAWALILSDLGNLDDREEDEELTNYIARKFGMNIVGEFFGLFPFIRDAYGLIAEGYDIDTIDELGAIQDGLGLISTIIEKTVNGETIPPGELARDIALYGGRFLGVPVRNMEKIATAALMISGNKEEYYRYRSIVGIRTSSNKEMAQAIREGNDEMVRTIVEDRLKAREITISDVVITEIANLARVGSNVTMTGIRDTYTIDGVEYKLEEKDKIRFRAVYNQADFVIQRMLTSSAYRRLNDEKKASLIKSIYNYYLRLAQQTVLEVDVLPQNRTFRTLTQVYNYFRNTIAPRLLEEQRKEMAEARRIR